MIDLVIVMAALTLFCMGSSNLVARVCILSGFLLSGAMGFYISAHPMSETLDPAAFGLNCMLFSTLGMVVYLSGGERIVETIGSFLLASVISYAAFFEYYLDGRAFYSVYSEAMILISLWQYSLLIRLGNVGTNIRDKLSRMVSDFVRSFSNRRSHIIASWSSQAWGDVK